MRYVVLGDVGLASLYHVGDEAMMEAAIEMLRDRDSAEITLVVGHPETATTQYGHPAIKRLGFSPLWTRDQADQRLAFATSPQVLESATPESLAGVVRDSDVVLIAGGGNMTSRYAHHLYERVAITRIARYFSKPVLVTSQTVGPELRPQDEALLREILDYARCFGVRDNDSLRLTQRIGGEQSNSIICRTADDAVLLAAQESTLDDLNFRQLPHRYIVASFNSDQGTTRLSRNDYVELVANTLRDLAEALDMDIFLVPHTGNFNAEPVGDEIINQEIAIAANTSRIQAWRIRDARSTAALTAHATLCIATRYHAAVFAASAGVPVVAISLSHYSTVRLRGAMASLGLGPYILPASAWDFIIPASLDLVSRWRTIGPEVQQTAREQRILQRKWWDDIILEKSWRDISSFPALPLRSSSEIAASWSSHVDAEFVVFEAETRERTRTEWLEHEAETLQTHVRYTEGLLAHVRREEEKTNRQTEALQRRIDALESRKAIRIADRSAELRNAGVALARDMVRAVKTAGRGNAAEVARNIPGLDRVRFLWNKARPRLSIILPVYNVAPYLARCLNSILNQSFGLFEVIAVDDGSTDDSAAILHEYASRDKRIRVVRQANAGLGAARNTGVDHARGQFLTFVDSDDFVPSNAFATMLTAESRSGADVVVGAVTRPQENAPELVPLWVRDLHSIDRVVTAEEEPQILRNFYTWNKLYRTSFWRREHLRFREGVLFEDQPLVTKALCKASKVHILDEPTYKWSVRSDNSSLTGGMYTTDAIRARITAVALTARELDALKVSDRIKNGWLHTLVEHHFPNYVTGTALLDASEPYQLVRELVHSYLSPDKLFKFDRVSASNRVLLYLCMTKDRAHVQQFIREGGRKPQEAELLPGNTGPFLALPFHNSVDIEVPDAAFIVAPHEHRLWTDICSVDWPEPSRVMQISGKANITLTPPGDAIIEAFLRISGSTKSIPLGTTHSTSKAATNDFEFSVNIAELVERGQLDSTSSAYFCIRVSQGGFTREAALRGNGNHSYARKLAGSAIGNRGRLVASVSSTAFHGLSLTIDERQVFLRDAATDMARGITRLTIEAPDRRVERIVITSAGLSREYAVEPAGGDSYIAHFDSNWLKQGAQSPIHVDVNGQRVPLYGRGKLCDISGGILQTVTGRQGNLYIRRN